MKLKLDENLGRRCVDILRAAGHEAATVTEQDLTGSEDSHLIRVCRDEDRCLLTLDLDFSNPLRFPPDKYAGIAVIRLPSKPGYEDLITFESTARMKRKRDVFPIPRWFRSTWS